MRILDLIDLNRGDTLKQGDSTRLRFQLSAKNYLLPDNEGKQARIVFIFNNSIIHEEFSTVQRGNVVEFSINEILPANVYILEIHVDGQIFPSDDYVFKIRWSAAGVDHKITKSYGINNIIERAVDEVSAKFVDLTKEKLGLGNVNNQLAQTASRAFEAKATQRGKTRGTIVFTDDDGREEVYTRWKPIADEKGIPIVSALITNRVGNAGYLSLEQINEMKAQGHEFVSHTHNSISLTNKDTNNAPLDVPLSEEEIRSDLQASKDWLRTNGLADNIIIYPYGHIDSASSKIVSDYFDLGLYVSGGVNTAPIRTYRLWRQSVESITLQEMKDLVDEAIATNGLLVFYSHCWNDSKWLDSAFINDLKAIIDYIKASEAEITTLSEANHKFKNLVESGEFLLDNSRTNVEVIGADGSVYGPHLGSSKFILFNDLSGTINDAPITFDDNCTTKIRINTNQTTGTGLPTANGGILEITRSQSMVYQLYKEYMTQNIYYRAYDAAGSKWNAWQLLNATTVLPADSRVSTTQLSGFPSGVSLMFSRTANSSGFPSNLGGQLITYNNGGNGYSYQEYKPIVTTDKYIRYATSNGWSEWEQFAKATDIRQPIATGGYNNNSPITDFPIGVTVNTVATSDAIGLPDNYAGILTTWRPSNDSYAKQEYRVHVSNKVYARYISSGAWTTWEKISVV